MVVPLIAAAAPVAAAGVSGAFSWLGGQSTAEAQREANATNMMLAAQNRQFQEEMYNRQFRDSERLQKEFAQSGIQWRIQDAKAAGVSPHFALGGQGASFSPSASVGSTPVAQVQPVTGEGAGLAAMGQDVGRAVHATMSAAGRDDAYTQAMQALQLKKVGVETELLQSQIARLRQQSSPSMPTPSDTFLIGGQGNAGRVESRPLPELFKDKPQERTPGAPGNLHAEPAAITDVTYARTASGNYTPVPSKDMKERIEDMMISEALWMFRNNLMPSISNTNFKPPNFAPKQGHHWAFNPFTQEYHQAPTRFQERWEGRR